MVNGLRTMNIVILDPDSTREEKMQRDIIKNLTRNKIHMASIQGKHIIQDRDYIVDKYRIITASAAKRVETGVVQGGEAIMINESTHQYITQITRQSIRVLKVTLDSRNSNMPSQIITTYDPHNGHTEGSRIQQWGI